MKGKRLTMMKIEGPAGRYSQEEKILVATLRILSRLREHRAKRGIRASGILKPLLGFAGSFKRCKLHRF
ncbi:hypothetical protein MA16_Dca012512 [Dendrobium catenatum]|uniref:Uncharacterized protein n=1 Tax=Dendrobium catenatum TaxID=906689 RepID=A0A2I0W520_9ASPA|nr:hypothetical protein MA16_Dca012512 [Dendrobium catenatum]